VVASYTLVLVKVTGRTHSYLFYRVKNLTAEWLPGVCWRLTP